MSSIKDIIKELFPGIVDAWYLEKRKAVDQKLLQQISKMNDNERENYLCELYKRKTGHELSLNNPERFTEKIQWRKLIDQDEIYTFLSDKYRVREWVEKKIGSEYLIPHLGCWKHFDEIDFGTLPEQFVLKTNNASHTNIIVKNKKDFLKRKWSARRCIEYWLRTPFAYLEGLELQYIGISPLIIAEQFLVPENGKDDITDYKFHCFNGLPYLCQVIGDRSIGETIDFFDMKWNHVAMKRPPFPNAEKTIDKPENLDLMIKLCTKLSDGFQYVRVDLYEHNGRVFFGEMTFTPASGMMKFDPDEWDYKLGSMWDIHNEQISREKVFNV